MYSEKDDNVIDDPFIHYIDCHIHTHRYEDLRKLVTDLKKMNIDGIVSVSRNIQNSLEDMEAIKSLRDGGNEYPIKTFVGIHPFTYDTFGGTIENVRYHISKDVEKMEELIDKYEVDGIGEIGLDYPFHNGILTIQKERQKLLFSEMVKLAKKYEKPIIVHSRNSATDIFDILEENNYDGKVILHSFDGNESEMIYGFKKEYYFSLLPKDASGNLWESMRRIVVKSLGKCGSVDKLLIESNAPKDYRKGRNITVAVLPKIIKSVNGASQKMSREKWRKILYRNSIEAFGFDELRTTLNNPESR